MEPTLVELILNATAAAKTSLKSSAAKIEGSVGSTDNRLVRSDGTGTFTVQTTGITVDDSNNMSGVAQVSCGAITASGVVLLSGASDDGSSKLLVNGTAKANKWQGLTNTQTYIEHNSNAITIVGCGSPSAILTANAFGWAFKTDNPVYFRNAADSADISIQCGGVTCSGSINLSSGSIGVTAVGGVIQSGALSGVYASETTGGRFNALVHGYNDVVFSTGNGSYTYRESAKISGSNHALTLVGDLICATAGKGLQIQSGTGARAGNATLVAGTVTVTNTTVTANTLILLSRKTAGGTLGNLTYTLSAGASFTINSSSASDTSVVSYLLIEVN